MILGRLGKKRKKEVLKKTSSYFCKFTRRRAVAWGSVTAAAAFAVHSCWLTTKGSLEQLCQSPGHFLVLVEIKIKKQIKESAPWLTGVKQADHSTLGLQFMMLIFGKWQTFFFPMTPSFMFSPGICLCWRLQSFYTLDTISFNDRIAHFINSRILCNKNNPKNGQ